MTNFNFRIAFPTSINTATSFFEIQRLIFVLVVMWNEAVGGMDRDECEVGEGKGINWIWRFTAQVEACVR
jgi:hypothetical protein